MTSDEREYVAFIDDIVDAAEKIERFTEDMTGDEFRDDEKTVDAVLRNFEVIGEATKKVPETVRRSTTTSRGLKWQECVIHSFTAIRRSISISYGPLWKWISRTCFRS